MGTTQQEIWRQSVRKEENTRMKWQENYEKSNFFSQRVSESPDLELPPPRHDYIIPGYAGSVPNSKHVIGTTYGKMTRALGNTEGRILVNNTRKYYQAGPPIRPVPQRQRMPPMSHHPPGYGGHIFCSKDEFGKTYGQVTRQAKARFDPMYKTSMEERRRRTFARSYNASIM